MPASSTLDTCWPAKHTWSQAALVGQVSQAALLGQQSKCLCKAVITGDMLCMQDCWLQLI